MQWIAGNREQRRLHNIFGLAAGLFVAKLAVIAWIVGGSKDWFYAVGGAGSAGAVSCTWLG